MECTSFLPESGRNSPVFSQKSAKKHDFFLPKGPKTYGLEPRVPPQSGTKSRVLSHVVHIFGPKTKGFCYIKFNKQFVIGLAKRLPVGLSEDFPAYLEFRYCCVDKLWVLYAIYLKTRDRTFLGEFFVLPDWLGEIRN